MEFRSDGASRRGYEGDIGGIQTLRRSRRFPGVSWRHPPGDRREGADVILGLVDQKPWWRRVDGLPPRAARALACWRPLSVAELAVVTIVAVSIVAVNKLIIED